MSDFLRSYLTVGIFGLLAVVMVAIILFLGDFIRPKRLQKQKYETYKSGVIPVEEGWRQSNVRYYIFALLFVMFGVETVFILPWAVGLESFGFFGVIEMGIFIFILLLGLFYAWRKGVLKWL